MRFRVKRITALLQDVGGPKIDNLFTGEIVEDTGKTSGPLMQIDPGDGQLGWVLQADCEAVGTGARPDVDRAAFVQECIAVERALNDQPNISPWFVSADFLIARALIETDITNAGPKTAGSDAAGPLQVSREEWRAFLKNGGPMAKNFALSQFDHHIAQIRGAAYRMHADAQAISAARNTPANAEPFLPSYLDVFHAYLTGSPQAALAIRDAEASAQDKAKPLDQVLRGILPVDAIPSFFAARGSFTGMIAQPKSVGEFVAATEAALTGALKKAIELITEHAPEELPRIKQGEAPWFEVAEAEEKNGVREGQQDARILEYFKATDLRPLPTSSKTPWCGAFAAFCMSQCDAPVKDSIPKSSALAVSWLTWGTVSLPLQSTDIPRGAVVVLAPAEGTGASGHVGFFDGFTTDGNVRLLGGNQSNAVNRKEFASRVRAIRWCDQAPAVAVEHFSATASTMAISERAFNLIVEFEVSDKPTYEKKYRRPEWPGLSSGVTIGIGYDVGHATKAILRADWKDVLPAAMITALDRAVGVTGAAAKPLAQRLGATVDVPWDAAIKVHRNSVVPRWVGVVDKHLPGCAALTPNQLGALVSLTFNRGPSFAKSGDRYQEMRNIKAHMAAARFAQIPAEIRSMKRLWPTTQGLRDRREREARLFET